MSFSKGINTEKVLRKLTIIGFSSTLDATIRILVAFAILIYQKRNLKISKNFSSRKNNGLTICRFESKKYVVDCDVLTLRSTLKESTQMKSIRNKKRKKFLTNDIQKKCKNKLVKFLKPNERNHGCSSGRFRS